MDCIWVNLKNVDPPFFKIVSVNIKMSFKQYLNSKNHSQLLCGRDFANEIAFNDGCQQRMQHTDGYDDVSATTGRPPCVFVL